MVVFPHCKINLGLHVTEKRADGYHNIETCFYPVPWTDILEIIPSKDFSFTVSGIDIPGNSDDNLCVKAYRLLVDDFKLPPVQIYLHKIIPTGAGLGGGSSDAAYTLRALNSLFELNLSQEKLMLYASRLGSDCSFFIQDKAMLGTGRGEIMHPIDVDLSGKYLVLVKPPVHVSTADAYAGIKPRMPEKDIPTILSLPLNDWKHELKNDFEESIFRKYPVITEIKKQLYDEGAVYASMSGSGASVFGVFEREVDLKEKFGEFAYWSSYLS